MELARGRESIGHRWFPTWGRLFVAALLVVGLSPALRLAEAQVDPAAVAVPDTGVGAPVVIPDGQVPYQVEIEVIIADLSKDFTRDLGFIYRFTESAERADEDFRIGDTFILLPATTDGSVSSPLDHGFVGLDIQANILGVDFGTFSARLQAAIGRGEGEILARPRIMTLNGLQAALYTGEREPFLSRRLAGTNNNYVFTSEYIDTGVSLKVIPEVILQGDDDPDNDFVRLNMEVKVDFVSRELVVIDSGQQQPVVSTRDAQTTVIVRDNNTFGIGGLYREDVKISKRKIPFLSDIPLLGWFFRGTNESKSSFELVVFITPRIDRNVEFELKALSGANAGGGQ